MKRFSPIHLTALAVIAAAAVSYSAAASIRQIPLAAAEKQDASAGGEFRILRQMPVAGGGVMTGSRFGIAGSAGVPASDRRISGGPYVVRGGFLGGLAVDAVGGGVNQLPIAFRGAPATSW
jgi:hypothetical protein